MRHVSIPDRAALIVYHQKKFSNAAIAAVTGVRKGIVSRVVNDYRFRITRPYKESATTRKYREKAEAKRGVTPDV